jgi:hypothetical protein
MTFRYFHRPEVGRGWWCACDKQQWLDALLDGHNTPKAPISWMNQQLLEGRTEQQAYIIWSSRYPADRKYTIWSLADDSDFRASGYLV